MCPSNMSQSATDILAVLERWAEEKAVIDAHTFLDAATKLTLLLGEESDKLYQMEQNCAKARMEYLQGGMTVSAAKLVVEASDAYREARSQKAKVERIIETVRIAKHRAKLADSELRAQ